MPKVAPPRASLTISGRGWRPTSSLAPKQRRSLLHLRRRAKAGFMVAIKASDADGFAARPDPARPLVLLYGPDAGLVRERAERIIRGSVDDVNDPFALV